MRIEASTVPVLGTHCTPESFLGSNTKSMDSEALRAPSGARTRLVTSTAVVASRSTALVVAAGGCGRRAHSTRAHTAPCQPQPQPQPLRCEQSERPQSRVLKE